MSTNSRKGWTRLAAVTLLPWSLYWGWQAADASIGQRQHTSAARDSYFLHLDLQRADAKDIALAGDGSSNQQVLLGSLERRAYLLDEANAESARLRFALLMFVGIPPILVAALPIGRWVYSAFRLSS